MIRIILKNLWNRRGRNAWLFIELVIVTALSWYIFDPVLVSLADETQPLGYDADRLVRVNVISLPENASGYDVAAADSTAGMSFYHRILDRLGSLPEVENRSVNAIETGLGEQSLSVNSFRALTAGDSLVNGVIQLTYWHDTNFFETFGIRTAQGSPSPEELSRQLYRSGVVITKDLAEVYWPGENAVGKHFKRINSDGDTVNMQRIVAVVEPVRYHSFLRTGAMAFSLDPWATFPPEDFTVTLRLRPGADVDDFSRCLAAAAPDYAAGNYRIASVTPYESVIESTAMANGVPSERSRRMAAGIFFLVNLILGVVGSFVLQTERRVGEIGVHRSYGATRTDITVMIVGEAVVLALVSVAVGTLLYLQRALYSGLDSGFGNNIMFYDTGCWQSDFGSHFAVITVATALLVVGCTVIGSLIPALRASSIRPVDALRAE